jgi:hypothetical protein
MTANEEIVAAARKFPICLRASYRQYCRAIAPETPDLWCQRCLLLGLADAVEQAQKENEEMDRQLTEVGL